DPPLLAILPNVPDPVERAERLSRLFMAALYIQRRHGDPVFGVIDDDKVVAAAVVSGIGEPGVGDIIRTGLPTLPRIIGAVGVGGLLRTLSMMGDLARQH